MESTTPTNNCADCAAAPPPLETPVVDTPAMPVTSDDPVNVREDVSSQAVAHEHQQEDINPRGSILTPICNDSHLNNVVIHNVDAPVEAEPNDRISATLALGNLSVKRDALKFTIDTLHIDEDPWHVEWMMFNIFNDFLQPDTKLSATEAAQCLDAILPDNRPDTPDDPDDNKERAENWLWTFAELIWKLAKQIPHDHESQDKILHLLEALDHLPFTQTFDGKHFWASKLFGWEDPSRWAVVDTKPRRKPQPGKTRQQECDEYVNAMAFAARCVAIDWPHYDLMVSTLDAPLRADYALQCCDGLQPEYMYVHVAAAAQWILHAGEWLWGQIRWGKNQSLGSTKRSLSPAQWVSWLQGYYNMDTSPETVGFWARVLASKMEEIMVAHGYNAEVMENWNPEKQTVHDGIREDPRYAHLFKIADKGGE